MKVSVLFKQGIAIVFEYDINTSDENKSRHNCVNNLPAATYFGFVSHLQAE